MFRNYFMVAGRNFVKNKLLSFINVTGISIGFSVALIIGLWVHHELTFNTYHGNYSRIALVTSSYNYNGDRISLIYSPHLMADEIRGSYSEYFTQVVMSTFNAKYILSVGDKKFNITGNFMEPEAVDMLGLRLTGGTKDGLGEPGAILLAESAARTLFGDADPVGKFLKIDNRDVMNVIGTYEDVPDNSDFRDLLFVAPWKQYLSAHAEIEEDPRPWMANGFQTFVLLADGVDMASASAMLREIRRDKLTAEEVQTLDPSVFLYPMSRWHLYAASDDGSQRQEKIENVWLVGSIGVFVLMLACINFINLSTARSEKRAAEVGVRKTVGSNRFQLVYQFFVESLLTITVAFVLCVFLTAVALPGFNGMMGLGLSVLWDNPSFWLVGCGVVIVTSILSGLFPALYLSSFQPVKVLKGTFQVGRFSIALRKSLVVMQFAVSVFLIACTIIVHRQLQYTQDRPIGYTREGLVTIKMSPSIEKSFQAMRNELKASNAIGEMAASVNTTTEFNTGDVNVNWKGRDHSIVAGFAVSNVTHEYGETIGWRIKEGRDFSKDYPTDSTGVVINEAARKLIGFEQPLGKMIEWNGMMYQIIGVIEDIVFESPYRAVTPSIFHISGKENLAVTLRLNPGRSVKAGLAAVEQVFTAHNPSDPFEYQFVDDQYAEKFRDEVTFGKLATSFSILAIFISCLGIYGMASFIAEQRAKEISIRKVLGAPLANLWFLLAKDFLQLIVIAIVVSSPVAYCYMDSWLQDYPYRSSIPLSAFGLAGISILVIALFTISYQIIRAILVNPAVTLKQ